MCMIVTILASNRRNGLSPRRSKLLLGLLHQHSEGYRFHPNYLHVDLSGIFFFVSLVSVANYAADSIWTVWLRMQGQPLSSEQRLPMVSPRQASEHEAKIRSPTFRLKLMLLIVCLQTNETNTTQHNMFKSHQTVLWSLQATVCIQYLQTLCAFFKKKTYHNIVVFITYLKALLFANNSVIQKH